MLSILFQIVSPRSAYCSRLSPRMQSLLRQTHLLGCISAALLFALVTGCGSSTNSGVKAAPITMTNENGLTAQSTAISVGYRLSLAMTPLNDAVDAGVDLTDD